MVARRSTGSRAATAPSRSIAAGPKFTSGLAMRRPIPATPVWTVNPAAIKALTDRDSTVKVSIIRLRTIRRRFTAHLE